MGEVNSSRAVTRGAPDGTAPLPLTFSTVTFGCKVNQYETQMMREQLGVFFAEAGEGERAGVVIVNTCSVTAEADRQARQAMRRARTRNPGALIVAAGCYARRPGVDLVAEGLADRVVERPAAEALLAALNLPATGAVAGGITRFDGHTRAFVKVQDGCDRRCSFCVIPLIRGDSVSRPLTDLVDEVRRLAAGGVPEVVLCGVRLNAYRDAATGARLPDLLRALVGLPELGRLRLSSLYPGKLEPELIELLAAHPKICRHLHLPIQSGSDAVLRAMRRGYTAADILGPITALRAQCPDLGLTADVLVGFPGETDADVDATERVVEACGFHHLHLFPFSARPGTPAENMTPLPQPVVEARMARLRALAARLRADSLAGWVGRTTEVVVERSPHAGAWRGTTGSYHPVRVLGTAVQPGAVARVRLTGVTAGVLEGVAA